MSAKVTAIQDGRALAKRPGASPKLLTRKARERTATSEVPALEDSFPPAAENVRPPVPDSATTGVESALKEERPTAATTSPVAGPTKVSKRAASRRLRPGDLSPNSGTIVATIVRLVVEQGEVSTEELVGLMASASFSHPKARPAEKGWSQGYVAGAIRNGFLSVAAEGSLAETPSALCEEGQQC